MLKSTPLLTKDTKNIVQKESSCHTVPKVESICSDLTKSSEEYSKGDFLANSPQNAMVYITNEGWNSFA